MQNKFIKNNLIARWLDNRLDPKEKNELDNSGELDDLKIVLDDIDTWKVKEFDVNAGLEDLKKRKKLVISPLTQQKQKNSFSWLSIAASILILITGGFLSWNFLFNQDITIKTTLAENKTIKLPDGSEIKLDALSSISFNKKDWKNNRIINLSGQAFFDVTKGNTFKVITKTGQINVLGTQFNVNATHKKFEVKCYEGKVKVTYNNDEEILTKGQSVTAKESKLLNSAHTTTLPEWINGYSKYNQVVLLEVIKDIEKYYNTKINLSKKYQNLRFSGTLTHKNLNEALETLCTAMEITYYKDKNNNIIIE